MDSLPEETEVASPGGGAPASLSELNALVEAGGVTSLRLTGCRDAFIKTRTADAAVRAVCATAPTLTELDLTSCTSLTPGHLCSLLEPLAGLKRLNLGYVAAVGEDALLAVAGLTALEALELEGCALTCAGVALLAQLPSLATLNLAHTPVGDDLLSTVATITTLTALNLNSCREVTDAGLAHLPALGSLQELSLESCPGVTDAGVVSLLAGGALPSLASLDLSGCENLALRSEGVPGALAAAPSLATLRLRGCKALQDESLASLAGCRHLRELDLSVCPDLSDAGLTHLTALSALTSLNLNMCRKVGDPGVRAIATLPALVDVNLGWCVNVTAEGLEALRSSGIGQSVNVHERTGTSMRFEKFQLVTARAVAGHGVESAARRTELIRTHASSTSLNFPSDDLFRSDDGDQVLRVLLGTNGNSAVGAPSGTGAGLMVALSGLSFPPGMPERLVNVWLPPDYGSCSRHPVVYAHDGQNLMNPSTAFTGVDWGLGASASGLIAQSAIRSPLIVMVDNAGMLRYAEYGDTPMGAAYRDWVVDTLKPAVDRNFATLSGPADTFAIGSSMGGLVAFLSAWRHPEVFGGAACLSPVFQAPLIAEVALAGEEESPLADGMRLYIDNGGDAWGAPVVVNTWRLEDHFWGRLDTQLQLGVDAMMLVLRARGMRETSIGTGAAAPLAYYRDGGALHNEEAWARRAWRALLHLLQHR
eukprot:jgi/Tetstr1/448940/TSEL_036166.t1